MLGNGLMESFFRNLKAEKLNHYKFKSRKEAKLATFSYIEGWYNKDRIPSASVYKSPKQRLGELIGNSMNKFTIRLFSH